MGLYEEIHINRYHFRFTITLDRDVNIVDVIKENTKDQSFFRSLSESLFRFPSEIRIHGDKRSYLYEFNSDEAWEENGPTMYDEVSYILFQGVGADIETEYPGEDKKSYAIEKKG